jgi:hypothetical protein
MKEWGYSKWSRNSERLIFWYSVTGSPLGGEDLARRFLDSIDHERLSDLPTPRRKTWKTVRALASDVHESTGMAIVTWLMNQVEDFQIGWHRLKEVYLVGNKIASWIMRDLSYLRDYSSSDAMSKLLYRSYRDSRCFQRLDKNSQKYFIPVDRWVFRFAKLAGALSRALSRRSFISLQQNPRLYLQAAEEIVNYAEQRNLDPRDLDVYWYMVGAGDIDEQGNEIQKD